MWLTPLSLLTRKPPRFFFSGKIKNVEIKPGNPIKIKSEKLIGKRAPLLTRKNPRFFVGKKNKKRESKNPTKNEISFILRISF